MDIQFDLTSVVTYAGAQNFIPTIREISLSHPGNEPLANLRLSVSADPEFANPLNVHVARIEAGATYRLTDVDWSLRQDYLSHLQEAVRGQVTITVHQQEHVLAAASQAIEVLAYDEWSGFQQLPELLTAFSQPNSKFVSELLRRASDKLLTQFSAALSGYQAKDRESIARQVGAIYAAISDSDLHYSNPPASFTGTGQKIRLPDRIHEEKLGTCLDLTMLMVSCLEQAGLNPLIFLDEGHAWAGCWLLDQALPVSSVDSREAIRKRVDAGELLALECTGMTPQSRLSFIHAVKRGADRLSESQESRFDLALDVVSARKGLKILPLALQRAATSQSTDEVSPPLNALVEEIDLLPLGPDVIVNATNGVVAERSRVDQWRARLLDLTLRNKLLNFKPTKQSVPLYYPEPAHIEDLLAAGKGLKLKALPDMLPTHDPRAEQQQSRATQAQLREHMAREAFRRNELLADISGNELDGRLTEIFRSARTAQEEGGSNTLFLAIGMLQWVDSKTATRKMQAPLVMVPVTLERQSVNSGFSLKRHDDDTIVNPTLLQLLEHQFELRIPGISGASELPVDDSGVDVLKIWASFRSSVVSLPGFEVLPDVWLGMFSFTKYLMWKDLTDRLDDILKSPLVRHLVSGAGEASALVQGEFTREARLDHAKQPRDLFIPTDCDSSQLAAVNAAAEGLSFVLEGPPGTGKSQTITNIISDALARGKTVLFVSEKVAALSVVHERLKKLGLGPFLLELHSAKATKTEVLGQFDKALKAGGRHTVADWEAEAQRLGRMRSELNDYVQALHFRHRNGWSAYEATAILVRDAGRQPCGLSWPDVDQHSAEQYEQLRDMVRRIASLGALVAEEDKRHLARIMRKDWSPVWQTAFIGACTNAVDSLDRLTSSLNAVTAGLALMRRPDTLDGLTRLDAMCVALLEIRPEHFPVLARSEFWKPEFASEAHAAWLSRMMRLENRLSEMAAQLSSADPMSRQIVETLTGFSRSLRPAKSDFLVLLTEASCQEIETNIEQIVQQVRKLQTLALHIRESWTSDLLRQPVPVLSQTWQASLRFWWLKRWIAQSRFRNLLRTFHAQGLRPVVSQVGPLLDGLAQIGAEREALAAQISAAQQALDALQDGLRRDFGTWQAAKLWMSSVDDAAVRIAGQDMDYLIRLRDALAQQIHRIPGAFLPAEDTGRLLSDFRLAYAEFQQSLASVTAQAIVSGNKLIGEHEPDIGGQLRHTLNGWTASAHSLRDWCNWQEVKQQAEQAGLIRLVQALERGQEPWSAADRYFQFSYADWWLGKLIERTPLLARFAAIDHERKIQEFRATDERFSQLTRQYVYARLAEKVPASEIAPPGTPLGILKREIQKKSRHMPVRKLLSTTSGILSHLVPCMLMSPLSVAQYLDTADARFDLVIFDEASQIPTWDAIGAIARGKQVIVVGDPKQLPPTNFFSSSSDSEVQEGDIEDLESILDECLGSGMSTHTLKWHYRSQRESLIAFSNSRYYGSQLITFPSPVTPDNGVTYHQVTGVYERSGARTNRQEAEAVVSFIRNHFLEGAAKTRSIGVVTFSQAQQKLIEDLLDAARRQDLTLDRRITEQHNEPLFVKNLENVQGDERDIILFSIGYGPDETGRVFMNFGPLNREGGHRRLNVAITRAKDQIHIFATLRPEQMDIGKTKAAGVSDLKRYLEFAIKGAPALLSHAAPTGHLPDSPFEEEVRKFLVDKGWQIHPQVGCSSYRIDLAVVDPRAPGRYLLAIECDGASYHSAATARDRDKLRQMVLERLGWKVHRIWSTEWWNSPQREQARLLAALEFALNEESIEAEPMVELFDSPEEPVIASASAREEKQLIAELPEPMHVSALPVQPYEAVVLSPGNREAFLDASEGFRIRSMIRQVMESEGPVSETVIIRRIVAAYGFDRTGNRIQDRLKAILVSFKSEQMEDGRRFYWPESLNKDTWTTVRSVGDRDIAEISDLELSNCARLALQHLVVADEETLIRKMGNLFGYQRVTRQSQEKLAAGIRYLRKHAAVIDTVGGMKLV